MKREEERRRKHWAYWFDNGQKQSVGNCKDGKEEGLETHGYESGDLRKIEDE